MYTGLNCFVLFVETFYGCYRNGLDGGKDMRSFADLHFVLRGMLFFMSMAVCYRKSIHDVPQ